MSFCLNTDREKLCFTCGRNGDFWKHQRQDQIRYATIFFLQKHFGLYSYILLKFRVIYNIHSLNIHTCVPAQFSQQLPLFLLQRRTLGVWLHCGRCLWFLGGFGRLWLLCGFWCFGFFGGFRGLWLFSGLRGFLFLCFGFLLCCFLCLGFREMGLKEKSIQLLETCIQCVCVCVRERMAHDAAVWLL